MIFYKISISKFIFIILALILLIIIYWAYRNFNFNLKYSTGEIVDSYNGVEVYFNGGINHIAGRNLSKEGYNFGLKYQCVEFIKRYYFEVFDHEMPNSYGNAIDFFDKKLVDGQINNERGLIQYKNPSNKKPELNDILVYKGNLFNRYGHISIISKMEENEIEIIQQNPGPFSKSREKILLEYKNGLWEIKKSRIIGWLRIE